MRKGSCLRGSLFFPRTPSTFPGATCLGRGCCHHSIPQVTAFLLGCDPSCPSLAHPGLPLPPRWGRCPTLTLTETMAVTPLSSLCVSLPDFSVFRTRRYGQRMAAVQRAEVQVTA